MDNEQNSTNEADTNQGASELHEQGLRFDADNTYRQDSTLENNLASSLSPSQKKRKRRSLDNALSPERRSEELVDKDEEDDGTICPICLDSWELSGKHRLISLRCGHLFGDSCIKRWIGESFKQTGVKTCPQCKAKVSPKDIRYLYVKRIRAVDRSEEDRLRQELEVECQRRQTLQASLDTLRISYTMIMHKTQLLETENERMKQLLKNGVNVGIDFASKMSDSKIVHKLKTYKLFLDRNIEIGRQPGCRVLKHVPQYSTLIATQKSIQTLFPGYGLRFIDTHTFRPTEFLFGSTKQLRDICLSYDQQSIGIASVENRSKLFDMRTHQVSAIITPSEKNIWACAMDRMERENFLYLGAQHGGTYLYDMRFPETIMEEFSTEGDLSPVINIAPVASNKCFSNGGFLVCKLQSVWFYEYSSSVGTAIPFKLNVEGPFISMDYNYSQETILFSARSSSRCPQSRYIFGKLQKIDNIVIFNTIVSFFGSKVTPVMTRCSQIEVEGNTLVAGYIQDTKLLTLFDVEREHCIQKMPVQEVIYDTCPLYIDATYLAGLTETKCRMYKLTPT